MPFSLIGPFQGPALQWAATLLVVLGFSYWWIKVHTKIEQKQWDIDTLA